MTSREARRLGSKEGLRPLSVERVSWACEPCGTLVRWMLELLLEHRARKVLLTSESTLAEATEQQALLEREVSTLEDSLAAAHRRLADADELEARRVEQAGRTSELSTEQAEFKCPQQCWINEISIDWAASVRKLAEARRYDSNRKQIAVHSHDVDEPVLRLSPGARSRATHRRVMFGGRRTQAKSLPCLGI